MGEEALLAMIIKCNGQWLDKPQHAPVVLGEQWPISNPDTIEGACDRCCVAMGATIKCRGCGQRQTRNGLCEVCEIGLASAPLGEQVVELYLYRVGAEPVWAAYDGMGALERLREARRAPGYAGFGLRRLQVQRLTADLEVSR
jgi:hypothetical protein